MDSVFGFLVGVLAYIGEIGYIGYVLVAEVIGVFVLGRESVPVGVFIGIGVIIISEFHIMHIFVVFLVLVAAVIAVRVIVMHGQYAFLYFSQLRLGYREFAALNHFPVNIFEELMLFELFDV